MTAGRRLCRRAFNWLYRPYVLARIARPSETNLLGRRLLTDPQVFHPVYFLSTRILIDHLGGLDLRGKRFLDMGTGSGAIGLFAAARGALVTACDVNPRALELARENLRRNDLRAEVLESNLFSALPGRRFDLISFNIPFYPKRPASHLESAFFAGEDFETVRAFAAGCAGSLENDGAVLIVFSEDSGHDRIISIFAAAGLVSVEEQITRKFFEQFYAVRFRRARAGSDAPPLDATRD